MRYLSSSLLAAQRTSGRPATYLTVGGDDYADKLERLRHIERPYGGRATILLGNSDKSITTDHRGDKVVIGYGFVGVGDSKAAPLWVLTQQDVSYEGEVAVQLVCIDIWLKLSLTRIIGGGGTQLKGTMVGVFQPGMKVTGQTSGASGAVIYSGEGYIAVGQVARTFQVAEEVQSDIYSTIKMTVTDVSDFGGGSAPAWNGDKTILEIVQQLTSGIVDVVLDSSDGKVDSYKPHFETEVGARVLDIIQDMIGKTTCGIRMENDGDLHVFNMADPGTDYTYDTDHSFFSDLRDTSSILPNRIIVINAMPTATGVTTYTGSAEDAVAKARFGIWITQIVIANVQSDAEAGEVAASMLTRVQREATRGTVEVPMNCGQELLDYIRVDDNRADIDYHGWVGSLEHIQEPGVYRLIVGLGGLTGGERIAEDEEYPLPNIVTPIIPPLAQLPAVPWVIPAAIQGYHHNITFTSVDYNTVSWSSGTIKFYDGTEQAILSGSYDLPDGVVRNIYFDLNDASPNVLKVTNNYLNVMSVKTGVVCLIQRGSGTTIKATVIPSYGKEPLITADVIYLTGLLDLLPDGTYGKVLSTSISAGRIVLEEATGDLDDISEGSTYGKVRKTDISAGRIVLTLDQDLDDQGIQILAGGGDITIDGDGITVVGDYPTFKVRYYAGTALGVIYAAFSDDFRLESIKRLTLLANQEMRLYANDGVFIYNDLECQNIVSLDIECEDIRPYAHEWKACGFTNRAWSQVVGEFVYSSDGNIYAYQGHDDIALLKGLKAKKSKNGRDTIDATSLPQELVLKNDQGQNYVNIGGLHGLSLGIMKSLLARIEALETKVGE